MPALRGRREATPLFRLLPLDATSTQPYICQRPRARGGVAFSHGVRGVSSQSTSARDAARFYSTAVERRVERADAASAPTAQRGR